jgi:hypothetical protein
MRSKIAKAPKATPRSRAIRNTNSRIDDRKRSRVVACRRRTAAGIAVARKPE